MFATRISPLNREDAAAALPAAVRSAPAAAALPFSKSPRVSWLVPAALRSSAILRRSPRRRKGPREARERPGRRDAARPRALADEQHRRSCPPRHLEPCLAQPFLPPARREADDDEYRAVGSRDDALGPGPNEHRLRGDAQRPLHQQRCAREQAAGVAFGSPLVSEQGQRSARR